MIRRSLVMTAAAVVMMGSLALPVAVSAADPGFKLVLTSQQTAVPMGATEIDFTLWNEGAGGEAVPITVTSDATWATATPSTFLLPAGEHQPVAITLAAGARGKALVTFSTAPGTVGTIRVVRAIASPIYLGVAPPRPAVIPAPPRFEWLRLAGLVLAVLILLRLAALVVVRIRRRRLVKG